MKQNISENHEATEEGILEDLSKRLKKALVIRDMKPIELSEKTGIPKSAISHYMSGYAKPKEDRSYSIAKALDVSETWLLGYDVEMESNQIHKVSTQKFIDSKEEYNLVSTYRKLNKKGQEQLLLLCDLLLNYKDFIEEG